MTRSPASLPATILWSPWINSLSAGKSGNAACPATGGVAGCVVVACNVVEQETSQQQIAEHSFVMNTVMCSKQGRANPLNFLLSRENL